MFCNVTVCPAIDSWCLEQACITSTRSTPHAHSPHATLKRDVHDLHFYIPVEFERSVQQRELGPIWWEGYNLYILNKESRP
jgi:hypothetical protein